MAEGRSHGKTVAWVSAAAGVVGSGAAVAALVLGGGGGDDKTPTNGPQFDPSRAEQAASREALAAARSQGWNPGVFTVDCKPSGSGSDTQVWNCDATGAGGACGGTVVLALESSGLESLRENNVACGE